MASEAGIWLRNIVGLLFKLGGTAQERRRNVDLSASDFTCTDNPGADQLELGLTGAGALPTLGAANTALCVNAGGTAAEWASNRVLPNGASFTFGTTNPATTGNQRIRVGWTTYGLDNSTINNAKLLEWTSSDHWILGSDTHVEKVMLRAATAVELYVGGGVTFTIAGGQVAVAQPFELQTYTKASLPTVGNFTQCMIWVSDEAGGAQPAYSDGTNWRRVSDGAIVS